MYYGWLGLTLISGILLGCYDIFKKKALQKTSLFKVLALYSLFCFILVSFEYSNALNVNGKSLFLIFLKSLIIFISWIMGFIAIGKMPISVITPFGTLSPLFSIILGILVLNERLKGIQVIGIIIVIISYYLIGKVGAAEIKGLFRNKYLYLMAASMLLSAASALVDKMALKTVNTGQMQFWFCFFLTILYGGTLVFGKINTRTQVPDNKDKYSKGSLVENIKRFPYHILLMSLFLVISDRIYFYAVQMPESQISVVMPLRKISILVSAIIGGMVFGEKNLKAKSASICLLVVGITLVFIGK